MMNNTIKIQEFNCPCCKERLSIQITESDEIIIAPFILSETNIEPFDYGYEFGDLKGGESKQ